MDFFIFYAKLPRNVSYEEVLNDYLEVELTKVLKLIFMKYSAAM